MIWFLIAAVILLIAVGVGTSIWLSEKDKAWTRGHDSPMHPVSVFFAWGIPLFLVALFMNGMVGESGGGKEVWKSEGSATLQNIEQQQDLHGRTYFLGSGYFNTEPAFYYYENTNGTFRLKHVDADRAEIHEVTDTNPHVDVQQMYWRHSNKWFTIFNGDDASGDFYYTFYVPKGSITSSFSLGPQNNG